MQNSMLPVGMRFMEPVPGLSPSLSGHYDERRHLFVNEEGLAVLAHDATATGSNASTGASFETDVNEDFD